MNNNSIKLIVYSLCLSIIGLLMIYSASSIWAEYKFNNAFHFFNLQLLYLIVSLIACFIISKFNYRIYYNKCNLLLFICLVLLILVLIPGFGTIKNGSRSWFSLGIFTFQPSEITKIALIIYLSKYLSLHTEDLQKSVKNIIYPFIIIFVFFMLIVFQPDLGSDMVMILSLIVIVFSAGIKLSLFGWMLLFGILGLSVLIIMEPYRLSRIFSFLNPWSDPLGSGYQIIQSLYAIGPSGLFGLGFGKSIQKQFYLPEPQNDFIFAIIAEEFGVVGICIVVLLYILLFRTIINISLKQSNLFAKYLSFGMGIELLLQAILNMCVVVGLIPVTGVTLPFISYGGSSLLTCYLCIGIILNINQNN